MRVAKAVGCSGAGGLAAPASIASDSSVSAQSLEVLDRGKACQRDEEHTLMCRTNCCSKAAVIVCNVEGQESKHPLKGAGRAGASASLG